MPDAFPVIQIDEWQFRERCRNALQMLLNAIGGDEFDPALRDYLKLILGGDRIVTGWIAENDVPAIDDGDDDRGDIAVISHRIAHTPLERGATPIRITTHPTCICARAPSSPGRDRCDRCRRRTRQEQAEVIDEMHVAVVRADGRTFVAFLDRLVPGKPWSADELAHAERSISFLHSVIIAHDRCQARLPEPAAMARQSSERRLIRAFEERGLTSRESAIASKILFGFSTEAIAMELQISEHTVKVHRKHLNQKLGVRSQSELFGFAYKAMMGSEPL